MTDPTNTMAARRDITQEITTLRTKNERLREEVERLQADSIHSCHANCPRIACVQRREIERLRALLHRTLNCQERNRGDATGLHIEMARVGVAIREALERP